MMAKTPDLNAIVKRTGRTPESIMTTASGSVRRSRGDPSQERDSPMLLDALANGAPARLNDCTPERYAGSEICMKSFAFLGLICLTLAASSSTSAQDLEYFGKPVRTIPVSLAVKAANFVFVSGTPGYIYIDRKLAVGDFATQKKQAMANVSDALKSAGTGWDRVVKTNVILVPREDFAEMNSLYAGYFADGKYPARTTTIVAGLPSPDFLLEIECEAVLEQSAGYAMVQRVRDPGHCLMAGYLSPFSKPPPTS